MRTNSGPVTHSRRTSVMLFATLVLALVQAACLAENTIDYAVVVSATIQRSPANITLSWPAVANATGYTVSRKSLGASSWGQIGSLSGGATSFSDSNVGVGS